jgi:hypothetical protein
MIRKAAGIAAILVVIFVIAIIAKANPVNPQPTLPGPQQVGAFTPEPERPAAVPEDDPTTTVFMDQSPARQFPEDSPLFAGAPHHDAASYPTPDAPSSPMPLAAFVPFEQPVFGPAQPVFGPNEPLG